MPFLLRLLALRGVAALLSRRRLEHRVPMPVSGMLIRRKNASAFTLLEVTVAASLMSLCATFAYATILAANRAAVSNRLFTLAQEVARNQIERLQFASPFNPQLTP